MRQRSIPAVFKFSPKPKVFPKINLNLQKTSSKKASKFPNWKHQKKTSETITTPAIFIVAQPEVFWILGDPKAKWENEFIINLLKNPPKSLT